MGVLGSESDSDSSESVEEVVDGGDIFPKSSRSCLLGINSYSASSKEEQGITVCADSNVTLRDMVSHAGESDGE